MKDYTRDYATAAFRFYAQNGKSAEKFRQKIYIEALDKINKCETSVKNGVGKPTEAALMQAEKAVNERISEVKDMEAVDKVLAEFDARRKRYIIQAIEMVYFKEPERELVIGDVKSRVTEASVNIPASERSIYGWLSEARSLFAYQRGLRIKN